MSVSATRTNLATNPGAEVTSSNWGYSAGGGTATASYFYVGSGTPQGAGVQVYSLTWTAASTSVTGGSVYSGTAVTAGTVYTASLYVRCSKAQQMALSMEWRDSTGKVISTTAGTTTSIPGGASNWVRLSVVAATAPAGAVTVNLNAYSASTGTAWAVNDWLDTDAVLIEAASTLGTYFDGGVPSSNGNAYNWTGTANASTSTAVTYGPYITLSQGSSPSPNVTVTFQDFDQQPGGDTINIWRTVGGVRRPVRGGRHINVLGSGFVVDYEAPIGYPASYDIEITSGACAGVAVSTATTTIAVPSPACGWLSDPLFPATAVPVYGDVGPNGEPGLDFEALPSFVYKSATTKLTVAGTSEPVALIGQRQAAEAVDLNVTTMATAQSGNLRVLLEQAGVILFRPLSTWASALPGLMYLAAAEITEQPVNEKMGGQNVAWKIKGDTVTPPGANVVAPTVTYGTVTGNYATYAAFNSAHTGQTYLQMEQTP